MSSPIARPRGTTLVFTAGVWDILHIGHLNLLSRAKALGDTLIAGVLTDEAAERQCRRDGRRASGRPLRQIAEADGGQ